MGVFWECIGGDCPPPSPPRALPMVSPDVAPHRDIDGPDHRGHLRKALGRAVQRTVALVRIVPNNKPTNNDTEGWCKHCPPHLSLSLAPSRSLRSASLSARCHLSLIRSRSTHPASLRSSPDASLRARLAAASTADAGPVQFDIDEPMNGQTLGFSASWENGRAIIASIKPGSILDRSAMVGALACVALITYLAFRPKELAFVTGREGRRWRVVRTRTFAFGPSGEM